MVDPGWPWPDYLLAVVVLVSFTYAFAPRRILGRIGSFIRRNLWRPSHFAPAPIPPEKTITEYGILTMGPTGYPEKLTTWDELRAGKIAAAPSPPPDSEIDGQPGPDNPPSEPEIRVYIQKTAGELFAAIENMTDIQIQQFIKPHIGKWIRVQSVVRDITQNENFFYVMLGRKFDPTPYLCFQKTRWPKIATYDSGKRIAAVGTIHNINIITLYIDHCELVDLQDNDDVLRLPKPPNPGTPAA